VTRAAAPCPPRADARAWGRCGEQTTQADLDAARALAKGLEDAQRSNAVRQGGMDAYQRQITGPSPCTQALTQTHTHTRTHTHTPSPKGTGTRACAHSTQTHARAHHRHYADHGAEGAVGAAGTVLEEAKSGLLAAQARTDFELRKAREQVDALERERAAQAETVRRLQTQLEERDSEPGASQPS
jgi:hypothetical protein